MWQFALTTHLHVSFVLLHYHNPLLLFSKHERHRRRGAQRGVLTHEQGEGKVEVNWSDQGHHGDGEFIVRGRGSFKKERVDKHRFEESPCRDISTCGALWYRLHWPTQNLHVFCLTLCIIRKDTISRPHSWHEHSSYLLRNECGINSTERLFGADSFNLKCALNVPLRVEYLSG